LHEKQQKFNIKRSREIFKNKKAAKNENWSFVGNAVKNCFEVFDLNLVFFYLRTI
jgi:hypothetical protein